jgi:hypothetical protein
VLSEKYQHFSVRPVMEQFAILKDNTIAKFKLAGLNRQIVTQPTVLANTFVL